MKRVFVFLLILIEIFLTSCHKRVSAEAILCEFSSAYPISATVYSPVRKNGEDGYIDEEMLFGMYGVTDHPTDEYALVLHSKVSTVREIGVFVTESGDERLRLYELLTDRIALLSSFADGEGFIRKYRAVVVYGFVDDSERALRLFDSLL